MESVSQSAQPKIIPGIEIRLARLEDLRHINDLLAKVQFDTGVHILELYYSNSNQRWYVAVNEQGKVVAFHATHQLPVYKITFGFDMYVSEGYQNRGIIRRIESIYPYMSEPGMGNATTDAVLYFPQIEKFDSKLLGYCGKVDTTRLWDGGRSLDEDYVPCRISTLDTEKDMVELLAYDRMVLDLDRVQFMRAWCTESKPGEPYSRTLIAREASDSGRVIGFGTMRLYSDFCAISPMYAEDRTVAKRLFVELVRMFTKDQPVEELYFFFEASNYLMMEFAHKLKFEQCDCEIRQYARGALAIKDHISFDKVYALHDYWPV